jgi:hypothetical protein
MSFLQKIQAKYIFGTTSDEITMSDFKLSLKAHNAKKEDAVFNENYNKVNSLGTYQGRALVRKIAQDKNGNPNDRVTIADAIKWSKTMLPAGQGYSSQDIKPHTAALIKTLQAMS